MIKHLIVLGGSKELRMALLRTGLIQFGGQAPPRTLMGPPSPLEEKKEAKSEPSTKKKNKPKGRPKKANAAPKSGDDSHKGGVAAIGTGKGESDPMEHSKVLAEVLGLQLDDLKVDHDPKHQSTDLKVVRKNVKKGMARFKSYLTSFRAKGDDFENPKVRELSLRGAYNSILSLLMILIFLKEENVRYENRLASKVDKFLKENKDHMIYIIDQVCSLIGEGKGYYLTEQFFLTYDETEDARVESSDEEPIEASPVPIKEQDWAQPVESDHED
jgi:hypothetical protein